MKRAMINPWRSRSSGRRKPVEPLEPRVLLAAIYVDDTAAGPAADGASWATAAVARVPPAAASANVPVALPNKLRRVSRAVRIESKVALPESFVSAVTSCDILFPRAGIGWQAEKLTNAYCRNRTTGA